MAVRMTTTENLFALLPLKDYLRFIIHLFHDNLRFTAGNILNLKQLKTQNSLNNSCQHNYIIILFVSQQFQKQAGTEESKDKYLLQVTFL